MRVVSSVGSDIVERCKKFSLFEWSTQSSAHPLPIVRASGVYLWDADGKRYLDFSSISQNVNIGHSDPRVAEAVAEQMKNLSFVSPSDATEVRGAVAEKLASLVPPGLTKSFFTLGGSDANEAALRIARLVTGRRKIVTRYRSYHGATLAALTASGDPRRWAVEAGMGDIVRVPDPYRYRCSWCANRDACTNSCLDQVEEVIQLEGPHTIAAVMVEPITGSNGIIVPPEGWLRGLRNLCDRYGILLIADEVMSGFGRTGKWFAVDHEHISPDIMTVAKGITSGYIPLGACIVSDAIAEHFDDNVLWAGLTCQSHPVGLAAARANLQIYETDGLIENSARMGEVLLAGLEELKERHPSVGDVRGRGLFSVIELVRNRETRKPLFEFPGPANPAAARMKQLMSKRGLVTSMRGSFLFASPPLIINEEQLRWALSVFDEALAIADAEIISPEAT